MKLIALTLAVLVTAAATMAEEVTVYEFCFIDASLAKTIAERRDQGMPLSSVLEILSRQVPEGHEMFEHQQGLAKLIYTIPGTEPDAMFYYTMQVCIEGRTQER